MTSILDNIYAAKRVEVRARRAGRVADGDRRRGGTRAQAARFRRRAARPASRDSRRDQARLAEQGRHHAGTRSGQGRARVCRRRRGCDLGSDRRPFQGLARRSACGPRRRGGSAAAQGFHLRAVPGLRSARGRRGLHSADRRDAERGRAAIAGGARARTRDGDAGRSRTTPPSSRSRRKSARR